MNCSGVSAFTKIGQMIALEAQHYESATQVAAKAWDMLFELDDVPDCNLDNMVPLLVDQASDTLAMERRS